MSKSLQDHHNDGQRDGAKGENNPPNPGHMTVAMDILLGSCEVTRTNHAENDSYATGNKNGSDNPSKK